MYIKEHGIIEFIIRGIVEPICRLFNIPTGKLPIVSMQAYRGKTAQIGSRIGDGQERELPKEGFANIGLSTTFKGLQI
jgi:hypothetical protein